MISIDYPPTPGGISAHVYELARALVKQGHRVSVLTRQKNGAEPPVQSEGIELHTVCLRWAAPFYGLQITRCARKLLSQLHPDIIHIHGMGPLKWYNITEVPLAYTNHTSGYLKRIQKGGWRQMRMLKNHFGSIDLFLAPSRELLELPFSISAAKQFIANGVDGRKYLFSAEKRRQIRTQLGLGADDIVAILTRRLVEKNGVIYLARAAKFLNNRSIKFIIIGDGPERAAIEQEFKLHYGDGVLFLGAKTHSEIVDFYSGADFSILPSLMEATSISGLEAMACSLPLVGTAVGGIPELIIEGENGYLCRPADPKDLAAKIDLLLTGDLAARGAASRRLVEEQFDWQRIADKTAAAYSTVLPEN